MELTEPFDSEQLAEFRTRLDQALAESDRGEGVDGEKFMRRLLDELDSRQAAVTAGQYGNGA